MINIFDCDKVIFKPKLIFENLVCSQFWVLTIILYTINAIINKCFRQLFLECTVCGMFIFWSPQALESSVSIKIFYFHVQTHVVQVGNYMRFAYIFIL